MPDVVVIGGGAAGIAAARRLRDVGTEVLLVEAGDRLGGRACSIGFDDGTLDLGCGWLHSAKRNPWTELASQYGMTVDRTRPNWDAQWRDLGFPRADQIAFDAAYTKLEDAARAARDGPDRPLGDFMSADDRWRPLSDAISGFVNGAPLDRVSLHDWQAYESMATDDNWAVVEGYGTLIARHARTVPVSLNTRVRRIDHRRPTIRVETDRGTIDTRAVILCVPTTVLARRTITFDPPLSAKHDAAEALPLGLANKVFLRVDGVRLPRNAHLTGDPTSACTAAHRIAPFDLPVIESFFGGDCAEALERQGVGAATDFAIGELVALLGSDWRARLTPVAESRWRAHPHIYGSYSYACVGASDQRVVLAETIDDRLFFAGEACSARDFATAHGAYATGIAAADAAHASLSQCAALG